MQDLVFLSEPLGCISASPLRLLTWWQNRAASFTLAAGKGLNGRCVLWSQHWAKLSDLSDKLLGETVKGYCFVLFIASKWSNWPFWSLDQEHNSGLSLLVAGESKTLALNLNYKELAPAAMEKFSVLWKNKFPQKLELEFEEQKKRPSITLILCTDNRTQMYLRKYWSFISTLVLTRITKNFGQRILCL